MARIILMTNYTDVFYSTELLRGIVRYCRDHRPWSLYKLSRSYLEDNGLHSVVEFAVRWRADAIIGQFREGDDLGEFMRRGIVVISQDHDARFEGVCNIIGEHREIGRKCADYFIKKGFRHYAFYGREDKSWSEERLKGYKEEIYACVPGCTFSSRKCQGDGSEWWWYDVTTLKHWLHSLPKPVAIMACHDSAAYHIIEACQNDPDGDLGIPERISVIGVDNDETVCLLCHPQLSSISRNVEQVGYEAAHTIDTLMSLPPEERFKTVAPNIVTRCSAIASRNSTDAFTHDNSYVNDVLGYINKHIDDDIKISRLVETLPVSRRLLETVFKREMGVSIYQFILSARVERIKNFILGGDSAKDALAKINIDSRTLSNLFRQATGMTPLRYEKSIRR